MEQCLALYVDEHGEMAGPNRYLTLRLAIELVRDLLDSKLIAITLILRQRFVLVFRPEGPFILQIAGSLHVE